MNLFRNLIRLAVVTIAADDSEDYQVAQVTYMGRVSKAHVVTPYGMSFNPSVDTEGVLFQIAGAPDNLLFIPYAGVKRKKGLNPGEVSFGNPETTARISFDEAGGVEIGSDAGELVQEVINLVDALQNATTATSIGPQPLDPATQAQFVAIKGILTAIKGVLL